jgi:hypothetical protein
VGPSGCQRWFAVAVFAAAMTSACAAPTQSGSTPAAPVPGTPELAGTSWHLTFIQGHPPESDVPRKLAILDAIVQASVGTCAARGPGLFAGGIVDVTWDAPPTGCAGRDAAARRTFFDLVEQASRYEAAGDALILSGSGIELRFQRPVPPAGDPQRALFDRLRAGQWDLARGTTIGDDIDVTITGVRFLDDWMFSSDACGFGVKWSVDPVRGIVLREPELIDAGCADPDGLEAVGRILRSVDRAELRADGTLVVLSRNGELAFAQR